MNCRINFGALKKFKNRLLEAFSGHEDKVDASKFCTDVVRTAGIRCKAKAEKRTPVDSGQLRQNYVMGDVAKRGFNYTIDISNPVEYAEYVEFGHRQEVGRYVPAIGKRLVKPWVEGHHMLEKSVIETKDELPELVEEKIEKLKREILR